MGLSHAARVPTPVVGVSFLHGEFLLNKGLTNISYYFGILIPFWLAIGVAVAGALYPGYSQVNQAMSELGAMGAPTHIISPLINNYPLGLLFIFFGLAVFSSFPESRLSKLSGALIAIHGVGSISAGYFSCDFGCKPVDPSPTQLLHFASGMVMSLSLMISVIIWAYLANRLLLAKKFSAFSLACFLVAALALPAMAQAMKSGVGIGLYQRINYGACVIWVAGLAFVLLRYKHRQS